MGQGPGRGLGAKAVGPLGLRRAAGAGVKPRLEADGETERCVGPDKKSAQRKQPACPHRWLGTWGEVSGSDKVVKGGVLC